MKRFFWAMLRWIKQWVGPAGDAPHLQSGKWGERRAVRFLKRKRYKVRGRRVLVGKHDELDIVAEHGGVMVFVEVKTRSNEQFGRPFAAVDQAKRKRLSRAAMTYLKKRKLTPAYIRFDVIEVVGQPGGTPEIRHIENAFQLDSAYRLWW